MVRIRARDFGYIRKVKRKTAKRGYVFEASFPNPFHGDPGESRRVSTTFPLKSQAQNWLSNQRGDINRGEWLSPKQRRESVAMTAARHKTQARTFGEFSNTWVATNAHEPSVKRTDESWLRVHLLPRWAQTPINTISREQVLLWGINDLAPGKPGARRNAYGVFSAIMSMAYELGAIDVNPCSPMVTEKILDSCQALRSSRHEPRALTDEEIMILMDELPESSLPMFSIMLMTGIRLGEARELRWKDVDFTGGEISITRAVSGEGKTLAVSTPKTKSSERVKVLGPHSLLMLKGQHEKQGKPGKSRLVFPSVNDPDKHYSAALFNKNLRNACKRRGIAHMSAHDLRNTWADRGGRHAESVRDVQEALGHTTASMSIHYMRTNDQAQRSLQAAVEEQFTTAIEGETP